MLARLRQEKAFAHTRDVLIVGQPTRILSVMASFADAPPGNVATGEKIFKTKCAQCHVAEKGGSHKLVRAACITSINRY